MCAQRRLRSAWASAGSLATHWVHNEDSDQTLQMPRLIWVFAGCTCHFVGFVMRQLKYHNWFPLQYVLFFCFFFFLKKTRFPFSLLQWFVWKFPAIVQQWSRLYFYPLSNGLYQACAENLPISTKMPFFWPESAAHSQLEKIPFLIVFCCSSIGTSLTSKQPPRHGWSLNIESVRSLLKYFWLIYKCNIFKERIDSITLCSSGHLGESSDQNS